MEKYVFADGLELPYLASRQNPRVVTAARLDEKKHREKSGLFLCEGAKLTHEAALFGYLREVYVRESDAELHESALLEALDVGGEAFVLSDAAFDKISTEKAPQGIISLAAKREALRDIPPCGNILFLDSLRDPGNLGTVLRSACALGNVSVTLYSCADLYAPRTVRAAMGALFKLNIIELASPEDFLGECRRRGRRILGAALRDDCLTLGSYDTRSDDVIVIGNEGHGISDAVCELCDDFVIIPMNENTESLNAATAASVILWEYARGVC